jgi:hypothetical protein
LIETDQQRRWWFATHPEFSSHEDHKARNDAGMEHAKTQFQKGWNDGYWSTWRNKIPHLDPTDTSPYAVGLRTGVKTALDEKVELTRKIDSLAYMMGSGHSYRLREELIKNGYPSRGSDYHAHHIVPWDHWRASPARTVLEKFGINVDSLANGVWLHKEFHYTLNNSKKYMEAVNRALEKAGSKEEALQILGKLKGKLLKGKY